MPIYPITCTRIASYYELGKDASKVIRRNRKEVSMVVANESVGNLFPHPDVTAIRLVASGIRVVLAPAFSDRFLATASEQKLLCISANQSKDMALLIKVLYSRNVVQVKDEEGFLIYSPTPIEVDLQSNLLTLDDMRVISFYAPVGHLPHFFET